MDGVIGGVINRLKDDNMYNETNIMIVNTIILSIYSRCKLIMLFSQIYSRCQTMVLEQ